MKLSINRNITSNKYNVDIAFQEYGSTTLTSDEERELVESYSPKFTYNEITFTGKYKVEQGKIVKDDANGTDVNLTISNRSVIIDDTLKCSFKLSIDEIGADEIKGTLNTADIVAKAKIQLFTDKIVDKIKTVLATHASALDGWEGEETVTV